MAVTTSDSWRPTTTDTTRTISPGAGVSGKTAVQVTNNTGWNLLIGDTGTPPNAPESAKYVVPPRSTGIFPVTFGTVSYRWTGLVNTTGDLISSIFSDDDVAPQVIPGIQAPTTINAFGNATAISRSLIPTSGGALQGPFVVDGQNFYIAGASAINNHPFDVLVWRNVNGVATDVIAIIPAYGTAQFNVGDFQFWLGVSAPYYGLAPPLLVPNGATVDFVFYDKPFNQPSVGSLTDYGNTPPLLEYQQTTLVDLAGFAIGTPIPMLTIPTNQLWCISEIELIAAGQSTAAANPTFDYYTMDLRWGFTGSAATRNIGRFINAWAVGVGGAGMARYHAVKPMLVASDGLNANELRLTLAATGGHLPSLRNVTGHISAWRIA